MKLTSANLNTIEMLRQISIFSETPLYILEDLAEVLKPINTVVGDYVIRQGEDGDCMFIIVDGSVTVKNNANIIATLHEGNIFGEYALLSPGPRSASIIAQSNLKLLKLTQDDFYATIGKRTEVLKGIIRLLIGRVKETNNLMQEGFQKREEKIEKVSEELEIFLYRSSHNLRRPITTIYGLIELMKIDKSDGMVDYVLEHIKQTATDMDTMLHKLLMLNEVDHAENYNTEHIDFYHLVSKLVDEDFSHLFQQMSLKIDGNAAFPTKPYLLKTIVSNLIENAVNFRKMNRQEKGELLIKLGESQENINIEITDNGVGIFPEVQKRIFDMFYVGSEQSKGNGLGLYVANRALRRMGGDIKVYSKPDELTTFTLNIPKTQTIFKVA